MKYYELCRLCRNLPFIAMTYIKMWVDSLHEKLGGKYKKAQPIKRPIFKQESPDIATYTNFSIESDGKKIGVVQDLKIDIISNTIEFTKFLLYKDIENLKDCPPKQITVTCRTPNGPTKEVIRLNNCQVLAFEVDVTVSRLTASVTIKLKGN